MNDKFTKLTFDEMSILLENVCKQAYEKDGVVLAGIDDMVEWLEQNKNGTIELDVIDLGDNAYMRNTYFKYQND
ncbi:hypothetical protein [Staphylococcus caprae]|uniref:hypothetical protein n=1 Tax=Staphylococcus caprae TaxID=29380 RepID=UPI003B21160D